MHYADDGWWTLTIDVDTNSAFTYRYMVREDGDVSRKEWGGEHCFRPTFGISAYQVYDEWFQIAKDHPFHSSAVQQSGILRREKLPVTETEKAGVRFEINAPALLPHEALAVVGTFMAQPWSVESACIMSDRHYPVWSVTFPGEIVCLPVEYKFVVVDKSTRHIIAWEEGENRRLPFLVEAWRVNWLTTRMSPRVSSTERFITPRSSSKMRRFTILCVSQSMSSRLSLSSMPTRMSIPRPMADFCLPSMVTEACAVRWMTVLTSLVFRD